MRTKGTGDKEGDLFSFLVWSVYHERMEMQAPEKIFVINIIDRSLIFKINKSYKETTIAQNVYVIYYSIVCDRNKLGKISINEKSNGSYYFKQLHSY